MGRRADSRRREAELVRVGFGVSDQFRDGCGLNQWMDDDDLWLANDARDRRDIAHEIEFEVLVKSRVDRSRGGDHEKGVAVRWRAYDHFGAEVASGSWSILDHEGLSEVLRQPLGHDATDDIG